MDQDEKDAGDLMKYAGRQIGISLITLALLAPFGYLFVKRGQRNFDENLQLITECTRVAKGTNDVLTTPMMVDLARGLGYNGQIFPGEPVRIYIPKHVGEGYEPILEIGQKDFSGFLDSFISCFSFHYRVGKRVTREEMKDYLASHRTNSSHN